MGRKAILRGVGAGLKQFKQNQRTDARLEKEDAFKERELTIREEESTLRRQGLELTNMQNRAKIAHGNLVKTAMSSGYTDINSGYGSQPMASAMTKYLNDGRAYKHVGYDDNKLPVWEIGVYKTDPQTGKVIQANDGKPDFRPLKDADGNPLTKKFTDEQNWVDFVNGNMNPDSMFALQAEDRTYANTERDHKDELRRASEQAQVDAGTEKGAAAISLTRQQAATSAAQEKKLLAEAKGGGTTKAQAGVSTRQGIGGEVKRTAKESDNDKAEFNSRKDAYPGLSIDQSFMMSQIKGGNKKISQAFADSIEDALGDPEAIDDFIRQATGPKVNLPLGFVQELVERAELLQQQQLKTQSDSPKEQAKKKAAFKEELFTFF